MCFTVDPRFPKSLRFNDDLLVIKRGDDMMTGLLEKGKRKSYFRCSCNNYIYGQDECQPSILIRPVKEEEVVIGPDDNPYNAIVKEIDRGYHAWWDFTFGFNSLNYLGVFVIPKKKPVYINSCGETVSSELIFLYPLSDIVTPKGEVNLPAQFPNVRLKLLFKGHEPCEIEFANTLIESKVR